MAPEEKKPPRKEKESVEKEVLPEEKPETLKAKERPEIEEEAKKPEAEKKVKPEVGEKEVPPKKKKIRRLTFKEVEEKLKFTESSMGGFRSKYAQHLLKRKEQLLKKYPPE